MRHQDHNARQMDFYGLQRREASGSKAAREAAEAEEREAREAFEKAQAEAMERDAVERFHDEVDAVAGILGRGYRPFMRYVDALGWSATPEGKPKVDRVTLRGLSSMTVEEAVAKGFISSRGINEATYQRALLLQAAPELPPHSEYDEHGFPIEGGVGGL